MDIESLATLVGDDRNSGLHPFLVVGTAGTTSAGAIDPLPELAQFCVDQGVRFHVDAAWAGAVALSDHLRPLLDGVEHADSITVDAHKWFSAPMGAGMFLCTDEPGLYETFRVSTAYMPPSEEGVSDPYTHSMQWSRRFIGFKLFLSLAAAGRAGYARQIEADCELGDVLRRKLASDGWRIVNRTPLPIVCFENPDVADTAPDRSEAYHADIASSVIERGRFWISTTRVRDRPALRACVTSFRTTESDIDELVSDLRFASKLPS